MFLASSKKPKSLSTLGWFMYICSLISQKTWSYMSASLIFVLFITFNAKIVRVYFSSAR